MAKTKEELNELKQEYEALNDKLKELNPEELKEVTGAGGWIFGPTTWMKCSSCGHTTMWNGNYTGKYECPVCHEITFEPAGI